MANLFNPSELYDLLASQGVLPQWAKQSPIGDATAEYFIDPNRVVSIDPATSYNKPRATTSLAHELTHSAQFKVFFDAASNIQKKIREDKKVSPEELQFLENAQKMYNKSFGTINQGNFQKEQERSSNLDKAVAAMYKMSGEGGRKSEFDRYRTSPVELQAFGIGRMSQGGSRTTNNKNPNPHLDPSFATEFAILAEQFKKLPQDIKTTSESTKKTITSSRKKDTEERPYYLFEDILKDPFAPTIK